MTRLRLLLVSLPALASTALFSAGVQADGDGPGSASAQFTVTGQAPKVCALPSPQATGSATNATFAGNAVNITQFIDSSNARVVASNLSLQYPSTLCNYNATLSIKSTNGGLVSTDAGSVASAGAFLQNVPYTIQAVWGPVSLMLDTNNASKGSAVLASTQTNGAISGNLELHFAVAGSTLPVPQGTYQDTILIKIGAQM